MKRRRVIDLVNSAVYPGLDRKPGVSNWVDRAGGLPSYIERIAKHLHYERGYSISRAIASAVNTVKRWAKMGTVAKYGDPNHKHVNADTVAKASAAVAEWYAKRAAGKLHLTEAEFIAIELCEVTDEFAIDLAEEMGFEVIDLADANIQRANTMIALMLPPDVAKKLSVDGGVPPQDMHITLTFHGDTTQAQYDAICKDLAAWAANGGPGELSGHLGGLGQFPAGPDGVPHYVPADVPGINALHEQVKAVTQKIAPASQDHGYTPHSTLTYTKDGQQPPDPVPATPVKFDSLHVVRGNKDRTKIPLKQGAGAMLSQHGTLRAEDIDLTQETMDLDALVERVNQIDDPVARGAARQKVLDLAIANRKPAPKPRDIGLAEALISDLIDLASTIAPRNARGLATDGRRSYKGQGKYKHGFIPVNQAAKEAKAKGSPIAIKRLNRLFGANSAPDSPRSNPRGPKIAPPPTRKPKQVVAAKGRAGSRFAGGRKQDPSTVTVVEKHQPGPESAASIGNLVQTKFDKGNKPVSDHLPKQQLEASKSSRVPRRAKQNWDEIPANLKTVRNGTKYVYAQYGGKGFVTPWVGGVQQVTGTDPAKAKVMSSITDADAAKLSPSAALAMINNPRTPATVKATIRRAQKGRVHG